MTELEKLVEKDAIRDQYYVYARALDRIEPLLAALLTIAVGGTLISVMLPLIGIMGSIG